MDNTPITPTKKKTRRLTPYITLMIFRSMSGTSESIKLVRCSHPNEKLARARVASGVKEGASFANITHGDKAIYGLSEIPSGLLLDVTV